MTGSIKDIKWHCKENDLSIYVRRMHIGFAKYNRLINQEARVKEMEIAVTTYLRRATDTFDLSKNVEVKKKNLLTFYSFIHFFYL